MAAGKSSSLHGRDLVNVTIIINTTQLQEKYFLLDTLRLIQEIVNPRFNASPSLPMTPAHQSSDRLSALTLILLSLYWVWASAWQPNALTARDLLAQASTIQGGAIQLQSGADLTLQAAQISGQSLTAQAGVINGQVVNPNAQLHIDAAVNDLSQSQSSSGHDLLTQRTASQGTVQQTLQYTTIAVPGADQAGGPVRLSAPGGITVGASSPGAAPGTPARTSPAGSSSGNNTPSAVPTLTLDLKQQAQQLATQPGLAYMAQLAQRNDVQWQQVQLASQHWDFSQSGLTGAAAAVIAIAVAIVTYGAASALSASMMAGAGMTTTAGAAGASTVAVAGAGAGVAGSAVAGGTVLTTTGAALSSAAAAGMSSLTSEAAVSLAGNGGNIGQTLHDLGSSQSVHNIVASMLTAGVGQTLSGYNLGNLAGKAVTGCAAGSVSGTGCQNGAESAAITNAAAWTYNTVIGYDADAGPGKTPAPGTKDYPVYTPQANGQQPVDSFGNNVIGLNHLGSSFSQGSALSNTLNQVPFINATAGVHDYIFNSGLVKFGDFTNPAMMPPAALFSIPAALGNNNISWITNMKLPGGKP